MEKTARQRAKTEKNKIIKLLKARGINDEKLKMLQSVISNTAMLKAKLDDAQDEIEEADLVDVYENGNQSGTKANPAITAFSTLWKSYMAGMKIILDCAPEAAAGKTDESDKPKNMLQIVMEKRKEA